MSFDNALVCFVSKKIGNTQKIKRKILLMNVIRIPNDRFRVWKRLI